ncbi:hypothetical protein Pen01_19580 [Phytomonospora endophytica]|nr:hypothetical protein Pen01_19580 [Phytomonospora endophytica]
MVGSGRAFQHRLGRYRVQHDFHLLQLVQFRAALGTVGQVRLDLPALVRVDGAQRVGTQQSLLVLAHPATPSSAVIVGPKRSLSLRNA